MKRILVLCVLIFPLLTQAQLSDDFSDGDFTNSPAWSGDASQFMVNGLLQLQLNSTGTGISSLSAVNNLATLDSTEWHFWIRQNFSPSSSNYGRVYLVSDQSNLEGALNGYYLQFGEALSNDAVELFRQTGLTSTSVCRGTNAEIASAFTLGIRVTRNNSGLWSLYVDGAGGTNYSFEASGSDVAFTTSSYFGVLCSYTSSNATNFFFDDFYSGPMVVDVTPPTIVSSVSTSSNTVDVQFSEPVEQVSAGTITNYAVDNGIGNPVTATRDIVDFSLVHLTFSAVFVNALLNTITIQNISDLSSNVIVPLSTSTFTYFVPVLPQAYDVVINEFMADPDPQVGLPPAEYVELYNRSTKTFDISGWTFADASTTVSFVSQTLLPGSFLILCSTSNQPLFTSYGSTAAFSSFPSLNNTGGETLTLKDNNGTVLDEVYYDETYYHNNSKSNGGWSIERIDPGFTCKSDLNWQASVDASGGTPGSLNSVNGTIQDHTAPAIDHVCVMDSVHLQVFFSEPMIDSALSNPNRYLISQDDILWGPPVFAAPAGDFTSVMLTIPSPGIQPLSIYTVSLNPALYDCSGNPTASTASAKFALSQQVDSGDVIINEVLAHVRTGGVEYVEIYNHSQKAIDLSSLKITRRDLTTLQLDPPVILTSECYQLLPGEYVALTDNPSIVSGQYPTLEDRKMLQMSLPSLTDAEDDVVLLDLSGNILDEIHYFESWQFPLLNDFAGVSLERISFYQPASLQSNWHSAAESVGFGTPGYKNSQYVANENDGSEVKVTPEIFSPDDDGKDDVMSLYYTFSEPGFVANATVFDSRGRLIRKIAQNVLLGTSGSLLWDGVSETNEKARAGIYVVFLEVFNANGDVKKYKRSCIVATKL